MAVTWRSLSASPVIVPAGRYRLHRGVGTLADRAAVHLRRLRPPAGAALELMPELLGDERAGIRYAINGLISMTPDGHPILGEMPEARGLWSAAASWIKEGPGCGRAVAELMSGQVPTVDVHEADAARFYPHQQTAAHVRGRAREGFNKMYGIVHPAEQWESGGRSGSARCTSGSARWAPCFTRPRAGSGRSGTGPTHRCLTGPPGGWWSEVGAAGRPATGDAAGEDQPCRRWRLTVLQRLQAAPGTKRELGVVELQQRFRRFTRQRHKPAAVLFQGAGPQCLRRRAPLCVKHEPALAVVAGGAYVPGPAALCGSQPVIELRGARQFGSGPQDLCELGRDPAVRRSRPLLTVPVELTAGEGPDRRDEIAVVGKSEHDLVAVAVRNGAQQHIRLIRDRLHRATQVRTRAGANGPPGASRP